MRGECGLDGLKDKNRNERWETSAWRLLHRNQSQSCVESVMGWFRGWGVKVILFQAGCWRSRGSLTKDTPRPKHSIKAGLTFNLPPLSKRPRFGQRQNVRRSSYQLSDDNYCVYNAICARLCPSLCAAVQRGVFEQQLPESAGSPNKVTVYLGIFL